MSFLLHSHNKISYKQVNTASTFTSISCERSPHKHYQNAVTEQLHFLPHSLSWRSNFDPGWQTCHCQRPFLTLSQILLSTFCKRSKLNHSETQAKDLTGAGVNIHSQCNVTLFFNYVNIFQKKMLIVEWKWQKIWEHKLTQFTLCHSWLSIHFNNDKLIYISQRVCR